MNVEIKGRHVHVSEAIESYAREKAEHLAKFLKEDARVEVILDHQREHFVAEMIVHAHGGPVLVASVHHQQALAAVDLVAEKIDHQLRKNKSRAKDHRPD